MNANDILKYGQGTIMQTVEGMPEDAWETSGVCGVWSAKDVIAHLASYEELLAEVLSGFTGGGPTPLMEQWGTLGAAFNDTQVEMRRGTSAAATLADLNAAHERVQTLAAKIAPETFRQVGTIPWYGDTYALDDLIVYMNYGHKREHAAQIAAFRDRLTGTT